MNTTTGAQYSQITFRILLILSLIHCINDALQSVISAVYPVLKSDLSLSFGQIGLITLVYQSSASVFQPITGLFFDKYPFPWSLPVGMSFTMVGLVSLAFSGTLPMVLFSVFMVGVGSAVLHPEASRLTSLASGGKRGLAQSLFQVGGNLGGSLGPLLVAFLVVRYGRQNVALLSVFSVISILLTIPLCRWYRDRLHFMKIETVAGQEKKQSPFPMNKVVLSLVILLLLIFSKYIYMASLTSYYTFYLMEKFNVSEQTSMILLFVFLFGTAIGTLAGGPIGDKVGRKYVIWGSILGAAPFALLMPHASLFWTVVLSFCTGLVLSSAFPAILVYAQELLPYKLGLISGLFFGLAFGVAGIASAVLGKMADHYGIEAVYNVCAYMPLLGLITWFLPDINSTRKRK